MMRVILFIAFLSLFGCKEAIKNEKTLAINAEPEDIAFVEPVVSNSLVVNTSEDLLGYWVGDFEADIDQDAIDSLYENDDRVGAMLNKKILLSIDQIEGSSIIGHSVVSGTISPFKGTITERKTAFLIDLEEYENKSTDGKFFFTVTKKDSIVSGKWIADNRDQVKIAVRKFALKKKLFKYDSNIEVTDIFINDEKTKQIVVSDTIDGEVEQYEYDQYFATTEKLFEKNASKELLTKEFVSNLTKGDIYILRNSIFARHGFAFRDKQLRMYFENYDWYMPIFGDVKDDLTQIEKDNVELLLRYEQNATEYYDVFGR